MVAVHDWIRPGELNAGVQQPSGAEWEEAGRGVRRIGAGPSPARAGLGQWGTVLGFAQSIGFDYSACTALSMSWLPSHRRRGSSDSSEEPLLPPPVTAGPSNTSASRTSHHHTPSYPPPPTSRPNLAKLSSKGKGKSSTIGQGWSDDDAAERGALGLEGSAEEEEDRPMAFGIRFTDGSQEDLVPLWIEPHETVRDVQRKVSRSAQDRWRP